MIPVIGVMIGLYIMTRMVELITTSDKAVLRVLGALTGLGSIGGIVLLISSSNTLSPFGATADPIPSPVLQTGAAPLFTSPPVPTSTWEVQESKNPLDDSPTVVLRLTATSGQSRFDQAPTLILRCRSSKTELYITWHDYLGSDETEVTTRLGRSAAQSRTWSLSTDSRATFYPGSPIAFIKAMMAVDSLVANTTPYNESPVTAVFEVKGLADRIAPLQQACKWS